MLKFVELAAWPGVLSSIIGFGGLDFGSLGNWQPVQALNMGSVDIRPAWESAWVREAIANDPAAKSIVSNYLSGLSASGYTSEQQGVWVSVGTYPVAENQGNTVRPAASLTKVATTLAALYTWGPNYRFKTLVGWQGSFENGVINGDLVIEGGDDPLFVWEEAIALGNALQQLGVRQVTGDLVIAGNFNMNFETSRDRSGLLLKQALDSAQWDYEVQSAHQSMPAGTAQPTIAIAGQVSVEPSQAAQTSGWLIRHDSLPLVAILKAMNIYSNNAMAQQIADTLGGPAAVTRKSEEVAGIVPGELLIVNGSGLGEENQMSPRAAVAMLQKIQDALQASTGATSPTRNYTLSDIFPITGADGGTVADRSLPANTVVKTGTLAVVSALAGALPTQDKGIVWFSLLNYGAGLDELRSRQDQVIAALEQQWGRATEIPPELQTTVKIGQDPYRFGDGQRNQSLLNNAIAN